MKKILIGIAVFVFVFFVALLIAPTFFKGDILRLIQKQSSKYIRAEFKIGDMNLSMFRNFPNLSVVLDDVIVTGENEFAGDTIVYVPLFEASVNLKSLFSGKDIVINRILLKDARLLAAVDTTGKANWDILVAEDSPATPQASSKEDEKSDKGLQLNDIAIEDLYLGFSDYKNSTYASIEDIDLALSGNFSETNTLIDVLLSLNNISYRQLNSVWVNNTDVSWQATIGANLQEMSFDIQKNDLSINDLKLDLTGHVAIDSSKYRMDLQLHAPDTKFESLLALIPKSLQHYVEGLKANGEFQLNATAKGEYYENHLPALDANLVVNNASVKYPELPESVEKIFIDLNVSNPGGSVDSTLLNLKKMSFEVASNPFNLFLQVKNPNDPELSGGAAGVINFAGLKKALPLKDITLQGMLTTDMTFKGKYRYIEKEQYEKFTAKGNVVFKDILFVNSEFPQGVSIPRGNIVITPARLNLNKLQAKIYSSDFMLEGYISNYLPYIFKNETLKGNFSLNSNLINLNEFIIAQMKSAKADTTQRAQPAQPSAAEGALEIPRNIDIQFAANVNKMIFDQLDIRNVRGNVGLANAVASLKNLSMDMLNGNMVMNGKYSTANPKTPEVDFGVNVSGFDIQSAYHSFSFIRKSVPITMNCSGQVSAALKFAATLDRDMSPVMSTANGNGYVESQGILIKDNPAMQQLASILKNDELSRIKISDLKINFRMENGSIIVDPFKTTLAGSPVTIYGKQSVEGEMDYTLAMNINRKVFGKEINKVLQAIPGSQNIETLDVDVKIGGTLSKPEVKPDLSKAIKAITKEAEKELKGNILNGLQNLFKKK